MQRRLPPRRLAGSSLVALLLAVAASMALAAPADAHAFLAGSNPADGEVLQSAPTVLRLEFSESVLLSATQIDIVDHEGRHHPTRNLRLAPAGDARAGDAPANDEADGDSTSGDVASSPEEGEEPVALLADLPTLSQNTYRISWETLSADDLHRTAGVVVFGVQQDVVAAGLTDLADPRPGVVESVTRWVMFLGLSIALGGFLVSSHVTRTAGAGGREAVAACLGAAAAGAGVAVIASISLLAAQLIGSGGSPWDVVTSSYAVRWAVREGGLLVLLAAMLRGQLVRRPPRRLDVVSGALLACVGTAMLGHSGAAQAGGVTRVAASAVHVAASGTWAGSVVVMAGLLVVRSRRGLPRQLVLAILRSFAVPATVCVAAMVVTGVYLSSHVIGSVDAALFTIYGRTLMLKIGIVVVAGALALVNRQRLRGSGPSIPVPTLVAEGLCACLILGLAAIVTSGQPAVEPQFIATRTGPASTLVDARVGDLQESVSLAPNRPGPSVVLVEVFDTRRPSLAPVQEVLVTVSTPGASDRLLVPATPIGDGRWSAPVRLREPGSVAVGVVVRRPGLPDASKSFSWTVGGKSTTTRPAVVSTAPLAGRLQALAWGLLVALVAGAVLVLLLLRRLARLGRTRPQRFGQAVDTVLDDEGRSRDARQVSVSSTGG